MTIDTSNADAIVARLDSWRQKAAASGRDADADLLDAVIGFVRQHHPISATSTDAIVRGFVPQGSPVQSATAECCPYSLSGSCSRCQIDILRTFSVLSNPERVFACLSKWAAAMLCKDKSFEPK